MPTTLARGCDKTRILLADDPGAGRVAEQLGRLPLALPQAGAVIGPKRRYRSYGAYRDRLNQLSIDEMLSP
jgi:hypothetical protein